MCSVIRNAWFGGSDNSDGSDSNDDGALWYGDGSGGYAIMEVVIMCWCGDGHSGYGDGGSGNGVVMC